MNRQILDIPAKAIRARCIRDWCDRSGIDTVVCLTCGNAAKALRDAGLDVVEISGHGELSANTWMFTDDVRRAFPCFFDATSGHLPFDLMIRIGNAIRKYCGQLDEHTVYVVPSGSGETVCCLRLAYPDIRFEAEYDDNIDATRYDKGNPLNKLVNVLAYSVEVKNERK